MKVSDFNYELPEELIAQHPYDKRDEARLMVLNKENKTVEHKVFKDVIDYLNPGDCLVINNTKVIPARLYGKKDTGANVEFLLLKRIEEDTWEAMVRPGNKLRPGAKVSFGDGILSIDESDTGIDKQLTFIIASKKRNLLTSEADIPKDFIERDLRDTQYIAKKSV